MKGTASELLAVARRQIGVAESPKGSNCNPYSHALGRPCEAWCQDFAGRAAQVAGVNTYGGYKTGYVPNAMGRYEEAGRLGKVPRVGAQVFFWNKALKRYAHTGWVESVEPGGLYFISIEGNTSIHGSRDGLVVGRNRRKVSGVMFGYPVYKDEKVPAREPKPDVEPQLVQGSTGQYVLKAQNLLNTKGSRIAPDGTFGPRTFAAVVKFQKKNGLDPDGVVGTATWAALKA